MPLEAFFFYVGRVAHNIDRTLKEMCCTSYRIFVVKRVTLIGILNFTLKIRPGSSLACIFNQTYVVKARKHTVTVYVFPKKTLLNRIIDNTGIYFSALKICFYVNTVRSSFRKFDNFVVLRFGLFFKQQNLTETLLDYRPRFFSCFVRTFLRRSYKLLAGLGKRHSFHPAKPVQSILT